LFAEIAARPPRPGYAVQDETTVLQQDGLPPPYEMPEPEIAVEPPEPLYSSLDAWCDATEKLIAYRDLGGGEDEIATGERL
jgi:hypothetical protein